MNFINEFRKRRLWAVGFIFLFFLPALSHGEDPASFEIAIETKYDAVPGATLTVDISSNIAGEEIAAFDFLVMVESAYHIFVDAQPGDFINRCGWQYFAYRYFAAVDIGINTPTDLVRITGAALSNDGSTPPDCYLPDSGESLARLTLRLREGCKYRGLRVPVQFVWTDCSDNSLILRTNGTRAVSRYVFDHFDQEITDTACSMPALGGAPDCCLDNTPPPEERLVDFRNGRIDAISSDDNCIDRGDLNCNGVPYEASDIVFFIKMFVIIISNPEIQPTWDSCTIVNSDVNADGITLSVADLVYLVRVVAGEIASYPKLIPAISMIEINSCRTPDGTEIRYRSPVDIGGLMVSFEGAEMTSPPLFGSALSDMEVEYVFGDNHSGALIFDRDGDVIPAGEGVLFTFPGNSQPVISEIDASDWSGQVLNVKVQSLPGKFQVGQNHPNPFNPSTTITLSLPTPSQWRVEIFNIVGQLVRDFSGYDDAGNINVVWDGADQSGRALASGIYFYRATVGDQSQTRKMSLLK